MRDLAGNPIPCGNKPDVPVAQPVSKCAGYSYWHSFIWSGREVIAQIYGDSREETEARVKFFMNALHAGETQ